MNPIKYQTGELTAEQVNHIYQGLKGLLDTKSNADDPLLQEVDDIATLVEMFGNPDQNLIPVDLE